MRVRSMELCENYSWNYCWLCSFVIQHLHYYMMALTVGLTVLHKGSHIWIQEWGNMCSNYRTSSRSRPAPEYCNDSMRLSSLCSTVQKACHLLIDSLLWIEMSYFQLLMIYLIYSLSEKYLLVDRYWHGYIPNKQSLQASEPLVPKLYSWNGSRSRSHLGTWIQPFMKIGVR